MISVVRDKHSFIFRLQILDFGEIIVYVGKVASNK